MVTDYKGELEWQLFIDWLSPLSPAHTSVFGGHDKDIMVVSVSDLFTRYTTSPDLQARLKKQWKESGRAESGQTTVVESAWLATHQSF